MKVCLAKLCVRLLYLTTIFLENLVDPGTELGHLGIDIGKAWVITIFISERYNTRGPPESPCKMEIS